MMRYSWWLLAWLWQGTKAAWVGWLAGCRHWAEPYSPLNEVLVVKLVATRFLARLDLRRHDNHGWPIPEPVGFLGWELNHQTSLKRIVGRDACAKQQA